MPLMMHVQEESIKEKPQVTKATVTHPTVTKATVTKVTVTKATKEQRKNALNVDTVVMANKKHVQPRTKDVTTDYCNGRNHFATVCLKKRNKDTTNQVEEESSHEYEENSEVSDYEDDMYLHPVYAVDENTSRPEIDDQVVRIC